MGTARIRETAQWETDLGAQDVPGVEEVDEPLGVGQALAWFLWLVAGATVWTGLVVLLLYVL
jgi:hypothetical protein